MQFRQVVNGRLVRGYTAKAHKVRLPIQARNWRYWCNRTNRRLDSPGVYRDDNHWARVPKIKMPKLLRSMQRGIKNYVTDPTGYDHARTWRYTCDYSVDGIAKKLMPLHAKDFISQSGGYEAGIPSRAAFLTHAASRKKLIKAAQSQGIILPKNWSMNDAKTFQDLASTQLISSTWSAEWKKLAPHDLPMIIPGKSRSAFYKDKGVQQFLASQLGGCPRIEKPTAEKPFRPDFPIKFVKYAQYSPHLIKKSDSKWLSLATVSILGQPPRQHISTRDAASL